MSEKEQLRPEVNLVSRSNCDFTSNTHGLAPPAIIDSLLIDTHLLSTTLNKHAVFKCTLYSVD